MDPKTDISVIGVFETAGNISAHLGSEEVRRQIGASMPLPAGDVKARVEKAAAWLLSFPKDTYMFLVPEIALMKEMCVLCDKTKRRINIILVMPSNLDGDTAEQISNNLPSNDYVKVSVLNEPFYPKEYTFGAANAMVVITGYLGGERPMVLSDTFRLAERYGRFLGKKAFIPYSEMEAAFRYQGWRELGQDQFTMKWRE